MLLRSTTLFTLTVCVLMSGCGQSPSSQPPLRVQSGTTQLSDTAPLVTIESHTTVTNASANADTVSPVMDDQPAAAELSDAAVQPEQYLSDDAVFALIVRPALLSNSVAVSSMLEQFSIADQVGIDSSEMEWVCISGTASTFDVGREMESITVAARTATPVDIDQLVKSKFPNAHPETVSRNGVDYIQLTGITNQSLEIVTDEQGRTSAVKRIHSVPTMALWQSDSNTVVFCTEDRLTTVLNSESGQELRTILANSSTDAPVVLAATGWDVGIEVPASLNMFVPSLNDVISHAQSAVVQFQTDSEQVLVARIYTAPGHGVGSLTKAAERCHGETCGRIGGFGALAAVELKPIMDELLALFKAADFVQHRNCVELTLTSQDGLAKICEGISALMQPAVASR
jgi:hypothetical protein